MSRLNEPGCMLRAMSAMFGAIFLPVGVSFFFILHHRHWLRGVGAVGASLGFFYVAWRAYDILGMDQIGPELPMGLREFSAPRDDSPGPSPDSPPPEPHP